MAICIQNTRDHQQIYSLMVNYRIKYIKIYTTALHAEHITVNSTKNKENAC